MVSSRFKRHHLFTDDKQLLTSVPVADVSAAKRNTEACVSDVQAWCAFRRSQLNQSKTEVIRLGTRYRLQQLADVDLNLTIGRNRCHEAVDRCARPGRVD